MFSNLPDKVKKYFSKQGNPKSKTIKSPKKQVKGQKDAPKEELCEKVFSGLTAQIIVNTLLKIQGIKNEAINNAIKQTTTELYIKIRQQYNKPYESLKVLLRIYGIPEEVIEEYEEKKHQEQLEKERIEKEAAEKEQQKLQAEEEKKLIQNAAKKSVKDPEISRKRSNSQQKPENELALVPVKSPSKKLVLYQEPTELNKKAEMQIEKIKKNKEERALKKMQYEEEQKLKAERDKRALKQQVLRRHLELGIVAKSQANLAEQILLKEGTLDKEIQVRAKTAAEIELTNLEEEEITDKEAIELIMKKNRKLFRHLFNKYLGTCYAKKQKEFDSVKSRSEVLAIAEFRKMLNDHNIDSSLVNREELITLFRLINVKSNKSDIQTLTFEGFCECFMQLAIHLYHKTLQSASCVPLVESINSLLKMFEKAAEKRGENITIYTNPEAAALFGEDQELLKELNAMIEKSPNYPLPEGYKKVQNKEFKYVHSLLDKTFVKKDALKMSAEILDDILNKAIGIHFIEPRATFEFKTKVIPDPLKARNSMIVPNPTTKYTEKRRTQTKSVRLEKLDSSADDQFALRKPMDSIHILPKPPKVSVGTRLIVASMPKEIRSIGLEVGGVMEEIIKAVEEHRTNLLPKGQEIVNKARLAREEQIAELARLEKEREEKRLARQKKLKQEIEEKKAKKDVPEVKTEPPVEKKTKEQKEKELEELRKKIEEKKKKKEEEKAKLAAELKAKQREEKEKRQKELEPFMQKKKEELDKLLKETEEKKKKLQEDEERKEKEAKMKREKELKLFEEQRKADKEMSELIRQQKEDLLKVFYKELC